MAALAGHAVGYTIGPISKHIIDCVLLYFTNGFMNIVSSAAANAIFKNMAQNIECSFGCVSRSAVLLKLNVASSNFVNENSFNMAR